MINHVVLIKVKHEKASQRKEILEKTKKQLENLSNYISQLRYIEVGIQHKADENCHDLCLISHFDNLLDLEAYAVHPEHLKVVAYIRDNFEGRTVVDFEF
ncbi:MAG: Dabb family protein [Bacteroidales bacterium]